MEKTKTAYPQDGGCWYCCTIDDDLEFCCEFDTYVHRECVEQMILDNPENKEAQLILRELDGKNI